MKFCKEELAWVAGFFDGDGCCVVYKNHGKYSIYTSITQAHLEVLEKCRRITGLGNITGPYQTKNKPLYFWRVYGFEKVQALIALIWLQLGTEKREQAKQALLLEGSKTNAFL